MNTVTSDLVARKVLDPAMDAIAHNGDQARIIHNPSPQIDSLVEVVERMAHDTLHMARMLSDLARSNGLELDCERVIAGFADDVTQTLRYCERNTDDGPMSGRELAATLTVHLDTIDDIDAGARAVAARRCLYRLFLEVPRAALFAPTVIHHLRPRRARALEAAYAVWENRRAARDARNGASRGERA